MDTKRLNEISERIKKLEAEIAQFDKFEKWVNSHFKILLILLTVITVLGTVLMICRYIFSGIVLLCVSTAMEISMFLFAFKRDYEIEFKRAKLKICRTERAQLLKEGGEALQNEE